MEEEKEKKNQEKEKEKKELKEWTIKVNEILKAKYVKGEENILKFTDNMKLIMNNLNVIQDISLDCDTVETISKIDNIVKSFGTVKESHLFIVDRMATFELLLFFDHQKLRSYLRFSEKFKKHWETKIHTVKLSDIITETITMWKEIAILVDMECVQMQLEIIRKYAPFDQNDYNTWLFDSINKPL
jgi:hypothetical protein